MKVYLAGEGVHELGDWFHHPGHRRGTDKPGLIESLLFKLGLQHEVVGATLWKSIRKFRPGDHRPAETRNVLGAVLDADEAGAEALIFVRDRDSDLDREAAIEQGIQEAPAIAEIEVAGGVAAQEIEAWILALLHERGSESHADAKGVLKARHQKESRADKVAVVQEADLAHRAPDCVSFERWIDRVTKALS
jgi:hypothetical protein